jgi:16S rRNA (uracil1498-N3)-methyltransferase
MSNRFYIDPSVSTKNSDRVTLLGDEAFHLRQVMRGKIGDEIFLFDGVGGLFRGVVDSISKNKIEIQLLEQLADYAESPLKLTIATALPKGDRQKFLVEKLAELGVHRFIPISLERSVARADAGVIARFQRYVIEAAKQCGRNTLMEIKEEMTLECLIKFTQDYNAGINVTKNNDELNSTQQNFSRLLLHPVSLGDVKQISPKQLLNDNLPRNIVALIGPEGSFTDREITASINSGFIPIEMGKRILRTETACITIAALLLPYAG